MATNYPPHNWDPPTRTYSPDGGETTFCSDHNVMLILNAITLMDYCPACSFEPMCTERRCYCRLFKEHPPPTGSPGRTRHKGDGSP